jgi:N-sulfoglucosamine sulfohydrolase
MQSRGMTFLRFIAVVVACFATAALGGAERPHIVVFIADDLSWADCSIHGSKDARTPNMERLAAAGITFNRAFVASPSCAPNRAALLTGLYPARNGAEPNHAKARADVRKLPTIFEEMGYDVAAFGKVAHYRHNAHYGFKKTAFENFHDYRGIPAAIDFLAKRDPADARPVCLFVGTNWPHRPWPDEVGGYDPAALTVPPEHVDTPITRQFRARYLHAVTKADDDLGGIYDAAQKHLGANTLFLFSGDHGAQWPFAKWNCYEGGIRTPLIVAWPGAVKAATRTEAMVSWIDILPTLIEAAKGKPPAAGLGAEEIDGRSFLAVLRGEKSEHRDRIFTTHSGDGKMNVYPIRSVREERWKYVWNLRPDFQFTSHVDRVPEKDGTDYFSSWVAAAEAGDAHAAKVVRRYRQRPAEELYDLAADPWERRNLAAEPEHAGRVRAMRAELEAWMKANGDERKVFNEPVLLETAAK